MSKEQAEIGGYTVLKYDRDALIDFHRMKCFYVFSEKDACFDCGVAEKKIFGYYRGEPDEAVMTRIAKKIYNDLDSEEFEKQVTVTRCAIIYDNGWSKTIHEAESFELEDA